MRASLITSAPTPGSAESPRLPDESDEGATWPGASCRPNVPGPRSRAAGTGAPAASPAPPTPPDTVPAIGVDGPPPRATNPITPAAARNATSAKAILFMDSSRSSAIPVVDHLGRDRAGNRSLDRRTLREGKVRGD